MTLAPEDGETWPIAAAMLPFPPRDSHGCPAQAAPAARWLAAFREVRRAGFTEVDLTDCWLRPGDLAPDRLAALGSCLAEAGLRAEAISAIRCSVIDPGEWRPSLAYSHRTIDAAASLGVGLVSFGLHRPLSSEQAARTWFWTAAGPRDDPADSEAWLAAVRRFQELADHAAMVGVALSLEMYEDTFLGTADSAVRLLSDINRDNVGLNPDIGNLIRCPQQGNESWQYLIEKTLPVANYWHVKNYHVIEQPQSATVLAIPAPMEGGLIDYRWAVRLALRAGFTGPFCVEQYGGDRLGLAARNRDYLRRILSDSLGEAADYW